jgi:diaminopimelate epimerase
MNLLNFSKYHGCRNSFIIVNQIDFSARVLSDKTIPASLAQFLCAKSYGIGSDGLMIVGNTKASRNESSYKIDIEMYNPDGSNMGMCGNGVRCITHYLYKEGLLDLKDSAAANVILNVGGREIVCHKVSLNEDHTKAEIKVNMGKYSLLSKDIPLKLSAEAVNRTFELEGESITFSAVSMGNPHCIIFNSSLDPAIWGPKIEKWDIFPERTNVEFVKVIDNQNLSVVVWERGVGFTEACGTGACAVAVAASSLGYVYDKSKISLVGGELMIEVNHETKEVLMKGPSEYIFSGMI